MMLVTSQVRPPPNHPFGGGFLVMKPLPTGMLGIDTHV